MAKRKRSKKVQFADNLDMIAHLVAAYLDERYKIKRKIEDVRNATVQSLFAVKREFVKAIVEALFLTTGLLALVLGIIMLLNYVLPLEYIFIGYGLIVCLAVLLQMRVA